MVDVLEEKLALDPDAFTGRLAATVARARHAHGRTCGARPRRSTCCPSPSAAQHELRAACAAQSGELAARHRRSVLRGAGRVGGRAAARAVRLAAGAPRRPGRLPREPRGDAARARCRARRRRRCTARSEGASRTFRSRRSATSRARWCGWCARRCATRSRSARATSTSRPSPRASSSSSASTASYRRSS